MQIGSNKLDRCRYGWMLHTGPYIGKCFELYGEYSEAEVALLRLALKEGDTALDVGANIGDLTLPMSQLVGASGRVIAFESHSSTFQVLNANMALNGVTNVKTINCFVADSQEVDTGGVWGQFGYVSEKWHPPILAIDALELDHCTLIKVDVDGKEYEVLKSAERTIRRLQPTLYFENDDQAKSRQLLEYVMGLDYVCFLHPAPIFRPDNFFANPVNHWAPQMIMSLMVLALPAAAAEGLDLPLERVTDPGTWWSFLGGGGGSP